MGSFDWKAAVRGVAPALAGTLLSPAAGIGVKVLADAILGGSSGDPVSDEAKIAGVLAGGITPELQAKIIEAERTLKIELRRLALEERKVEVGLEQAYVADTEAARQAHKSNQSVIRAALGLNVLSYVVVLLVLAGAFGVLLGFGADRMRLVDPGIAAMVGSIIGAALQFIVQNAAQASGFLFGSSPSSRSNAQRMAEAVEVAVKRGPMK